MGAVAAAVPAAGASLAAVPKARASWAVPTEVARANRPNRNTQLRSRHLGSPQAMRAARGAMAVQTSAAMTAAATTATMAAV